MKENDHKKDESEYLKELLDIQLPLPKRVFSCLAEKYIVIIKNQARLFEMTEGLKPTVFLTVDIWREILRDCNHAVTLKKGKEDEVFGYTVKLVRGENQLYLGYELSTWG